MPISEARKRFSGVVLAILIAGLGAPAVALDPAAQVGEDITPAQAYERAAQAYRDGENDAALNALEFAARKGYAKAQWELARRYAEGDGVKRNDLKAFEYFRMLADEHAEDNPFLSGARIIADSFVELSEYYLSGIPDSEVVQDMSQALNLLRHAATYFGDPDAQYRLGKMYLEGQGVSRSEHLAARWLALAARKNHVEAQGELGRLLVTVGKSPSVRLQGLTFLELARRKADPIEQAWILEAHGEVFVGLGEDERQMVVTAADKWAKDKTAQR